MSNQARSETYFTTSDACRDGHHDLCALIGCTCICHAGGDSDSSASRIASAPPDEFRLSHASPEEIKAEMKRSVEACDQPKPYCKYCGHPAMEHDKKSGYCSALGIIGVEEEPACECRGPRFDGDDWTQKSSIPGPAEKECGDESPEGYVCISIQGHKRNHFDGDGHGWPISQSHPSLQESEDADRLTDAEVAEYASWREGDYDWHYDVGKMARELQVFRSKSPEPPAGPLDVNRARVIEELLAKEGEFPTLFVNILRNWSAEKIGRLAEQLALRGEKPRGEPAFEEKTEHDFYDHARRLLHDIECEQELEDVQVVAARMADIHNLALAPIDLNATREEGETDEEKVKAVYPDARWAEIDCGKLLWAIIAKRLDHAWRIVQLSEALAKDQQAHAWSYAASRLGGKS